MAIRESGRRRTCAVPFRHSSDLSRYDPDFCEIDNEEYRRHRHPLKRITRPPILDDRNRLAWPNSVGDAVIGWTLDALPFATSQTGQQVRNGTSNKTRMCQRDMMICAVDALELHVRQTACEFVDKLDRRNSIV